MASILLIIVVAIVLVLLFLLWNYSYWYRRGVPQGNPLKLLGDLNDVMITFIPYWQHYLAMGRKFADKPYFGAYSLGKPRLFIRDANMIKDMMTSKFSSFSENGFSITEDVDPIVSRDPFFQKGGEKWKESRAHFSSTMTPSRLRGAILPGIIVVSRDAMNYLKEQKHESGIGDGINVKNFGIRYMTDILVRVTLSLEAGSFKDDNSPFLLQAQHMFDSTMTSVVSTFFVFVSPRLGSFLGLGIVSKDVRDFFDHFVKEQKRYRSEKGIRTDDVLDLIMKKASEVKTQSGEEPRPDDTDLDVLAMIIMFFMEGFETTSTTMAAAFVSLAKHEDIQENIRREVLKACPLGRDITEDAINSVSLLQNCITETLRMYPPAFLIQRVVTEDVTLQAKTGEEIHLKKGEVINIPLASLHRDPEYFPDPENFDPTRFEDETQKRIHLGFGDGPRQCPGQKFASLAIKVIIATVLREFKLELSPKTKYPLEPINNQFLFTIKDVRVRFVPL